ncbi:tyrosine-type recombinase/integrase [Candidatus Woesearchaeota archaeon]|nr:tyrosine-type recombinase/integrase [Candidatus Woesearchaeota archaeon]
MDLVFLAQRKMRRRRLSERTVKTYSYCLGRFLKSISKDPRKITKHDVQEYLYFLAEKGAAAKSLNVHLMAIKFACEDILNKRFFVNLPSSKRQQRLPEVLTQEEVKKLILAIANPRQRLLIKLIYGAGLRVLEAVSLRKEHLCLDQGFGWVRGGKGGKDRLFIIPSAIKDELSALAKGLSDDSFLFSGQKRRHYSPRSVAAIVKRAARDADIRKGVHPHTLRHSFATHLVEQGCDLVTVQSLLGHASPETSMVYVHLAVPKLLVAKSPLDSLPA